MGRQIWSAGSSLCRSGGESGSACKHAPAQSSEQSLRAGLTLRRLAAQGCAKGLGRSHPGHPGRLGSGNGGGHSTCLWPTAWRPEITNLASVAYTEHRGQTVRGAGRRVGAAPLTPGADGRRFSRRPRAHAPTIHLPMHPSLSPDGLPNPPSSSRPTRTSPDPLRTQSFASRISADSAPAPSAELAPAGGQYAVATTLPLPQYVDVQIYVQIRRPGS